MTLKLSGIFAPAILLTAGLMLTGCAPHHDSPEAGSYQEISGYSGQDLSFAQMMIPHHQQAVDMAKLAPERSENPEVLAIAKQILDAQGPEIAQMRSWLQAAGATELPGHMMEGMLTEAEFFKLEQSTGPEFDRLFLEGMIAHHLGAIKMAEMVVDSENIEAKTLGAEITTSQRLEIIEMEKLVASLD